LPIQIVPMDTHISWNNAGISDTQFLIAWWDTVTNLVGTPPILSKSGAPAVGTLPALPFTGPYNNEITGYPTSSPGSPSALVHRFTHAYSSTVSPSFHANYQVGTVSQDGRFASFTSDWLGGLGSTTGANACVVGGPDRVPSQAYPANFVVTPATGNSSDHTYQVAGACTMSSTANSAIAWPAGNTTDGSCTLTYIGDQNCRWDTFIVELR